MALDLSGLDYLHSTSIATDINGGLRVIVIHFVSFVIIREA